MLKQAIQALKGMNHRMHIYVKELHSYGFIHNTLTTIFRKLQSESHVALSPTVKFEVLHFYVLIFPSNCPLSFEETFRPARKDFHNFVPIDNSAVVRIPLFWSYIRPFLSIVFMLQSIIFTVQL